jgi:hypothetical protein
VRNLANVQLVDEIGFQEVARQFPAAHLPDVLALALAKLAD